MTGYDQFGSQKNFLNWFFFKLTHLQTHILYVSISTLLIEKLIIFLKINPRPLEVRD
jgi:hypothetical protein